MPYDQLKHLNESKGTRRTYYFKIQEVLDKMGIELGETEYLDVVLVDHGIPATVGFNITKPYTGPGFGSRSATLVADTPK